jgi:hypothetical protein
MSWSHELARTLTPRDVLVAVTQIGRKHKHPVDCISQFRGCAKSLSQDNGVALCNEVVDQLRFVPSAHRTTMMDCFREGLKHCGSPRPD